MRRRIIIGLVLTLIFAASFGIIYLNNVYLPVKVKGRLAKTLSEYLNYSVEIEKLKYSPIRGAVIQNIVVYDKVKDRTNTILTIKEASFQFLFLPLIKERKIIIPALYIDSPYLNARYRQDNTFNFSNIFMPRPKPKVKPKIKFSFVVYRVNITDARGIFADERITPEFSKVVQDLDIVLGIRQLTKIAFLVEAKVVTEKGGITALKLEGNYNLLSKKVDSKISLGNFVISEFNPYLKALPLSIASGVIDSSALDFKFDNNVAGLKGTITTKGLTLRKGDLTLMGDINIEPDLSYATGKKTLDYKANIKFIQASLSGIKPLEKISNISGDIGIIKNRIWTDNLKFQALDSPFTFKAELDNFSNPHLKIDSKSEQLKLDKLLALSPYKPQGLSLSGLAAADINAEGYLGKLPLRLKASLQISDAKLQAAFLKEAINNLKGKVEFSQDNISWSDLSFNYLNTAYTSAGKLADFKTPQLTFGLRSKDLDLKTDLKIKEKVIRVITFAGKYMNSGFDTEGSIDISDAANPAINLSADLSLNLSDNFAFVPAAFSEKLKKAKPEGVVNIKGTLNGKAKDYRDWNAVIKGGADALSVYNMKFSKVSFNLEEKRGTLNLSRFNALAYSGVLNMDLVSDLKPEIPTYALKFSGTGIDLAKLKADTGLKDKDMGGLLNISAEVGGNFKDPASLSGSASLSVRDGRLWQFNFFKGLGELFLLPDYEKIMFKDALGDFSIADKAVTTEDFKLTSEQLNLDCKGRLGFDGSLDFTIYTQANKNMIRDSSDIRKFTTAILGSLSDALTVKVSGTVQKPKYRIVPVVADIIKNVKDFILGK